MTVRLEAYDLKAVINGLFQTRTAFGKERQGKIEALVLRLIDTCEQLKPGRRAKIRLESGEARLILLCLNEWRNGFIQKGQVDAADGVGELMVKIAGQKRSWLR